MKESEAATPTRDVVERYIALWNEPDADARSRGIAEQFTEDGTYTDPLAAAEGHEAIEAVITGTREQFPGHVFKLIGEIDAHHDIVRFGWELVPEGGCGDESVVVGFDVGIAASDGSLRNVYGFLDKVPPA